MIAETRNRGLELDLDPQSWSGDKVANMFGIFLSAPQRSPSQLQLAPAPPPPPSRPFAEPPLEPTGRSGGSRSD